MTPSLKLKIIRPTLIGPVSLLWSGSKGAPRIERILLPSASPGSAEQRVLRLHPDSRKESCPRIDRIARTIKAFLDGKDVGFQPGFLDLSACPGFRGEVLRAVRWIPRGRVSTYGVLARHLGHAGAARAVGNVMAGNPFPLIIPCHRILRSGGRLGGFGGGSRMKQALLRNEGILFDGSGRAITPGFHYE